MKKENQNKKSKKLIISVCAILIYIFVVIVCYTFLKPQQYEEVNVQRSRQIAEEITYKGLKDLSINNMEITSIDKKMDFNTIFEKGLIYTNYESIKLNLKLDDMHVNYDKGIFSFEFLELTARERLAIELGLSYHVNYKINIDNLQEDIHYSKGTYIFLILYAYPFCLLLILFCIILLLLLISVFVESIIEKIKEKKKSGIENKIDKEEISLNFKLTNSCADEPKKKKNKK